MRLDRHRQRQLEELAALHSLKTNASHAGLIAAQSASQAAQSALSDRDDAVLVANARIDSLFSANSLDLNALRVGSAVLDAAIQDQSQAANALLTRELEEDQRRGLWNLDRQREEQADRLKNRVKRKLANKLDETASADAIDLQIARKNAREG